MLFGEVITDNRCLQEQLEAFGFEQKVKDDAQVIMEVRETGLAADETGFKDLITRVNIMFRKLLRQKAYEL